MGAPTDPGRARAAEAEGSTRPRAGARDRAARRAAVGILIGLFALGVWRAATQALTHDEALTWLAHVGGPGARPLGSGSNNHVLFTWLAWLSTRALGDTAFALRLPTLVASAFYFFAAFRVCRRSLASPGLFLLGVILVASNPYVLDFLVAARGYGIGLAGLLWALDELSAHARDGRPGRVVRAGAALGIAAGAQVTFAVPAAALAGAFALSSLFPGARFASSEVDVRPDVVLGVRRALGSLALLVLTALAVGALPVWVLLRALDPGQMYGGVASFGELAARLAKRSLAHSRPDIEHGVLPPEWTLYTALVLASLSAIWLFIDGHRVRVGGVDERRRARSALVLAGGAVSLAVPLLALAVALAPRFGMSFTWPDPRRAVGFLPLLGLAATALVQPNLDVGPPARGRFPIRMLACAGAWLLVCAAGLFLAQLDPRYFADWRYDAGAERTFERLEADREARGLERARLGLQQWRFQPALEFYRRTRGAEWLEPIERRFVPKELTYDYLVLEPEIDPEVAERFAEIVWRDPVSGVYLLAMDVEAVRAERER